ncbi:MAG: AbrB/MazE/SpoVT family DNA-binding domain-containing protein [Armatimonadetes bacterium]|nr:AbrB/MazE/SpoVT family DNA-binding domain-containing protein [Armatimonadota bacterium]
MPKHHTEGQITLTVVTRKGQITLPAEIRRALGLRQGDKVAVHLTGDQAIVKRAESVVARTAGAVKTERPPLSARDLRKAAEEAWAEDAVDRGQ